MIPTAPKVRASLGVAGALVLVLATQAPPSRIISVVPAVTEMLYAIGAGPQVVAVSNFDRHPPEIERLPRVGALLDPDVERILALRPDLVIVYATQTDFREQLERASVPTFLYTHSGLSSISTTMLALGARTGHTQEAQRAAQSLEAGIAAIRDRFDGRARPRTLLVFGRDPGTLRNIDASGGRGFLHDMLEVAGGTNIFADIARESVRASSEQILVAAPEVILEIRAGDAPSAAMLAQDLEVWRRVPSVPAVRDGRVHVILGSELVIPGPRILAGIDRIARALHGQE